MQFGMVAEQFATIIDAAVAVNIAHQKSVPAVCPTRAFGKTIVIQIKADNLAFQRMGLHPVAIQIDNNG